MAYVACTWLTGSRSGLPGGASMVLHLRLTATYKATKYSRGYSSVTSFGLFTFTWHSYREVKQAYLLQIWSNVTYNKHVEYFARVHNKSA